MKKREANAWALAPHKCAHPSNPSHQPQPYQSTFEPGNHCWRFFASQVRAAAAASLDRKPRCPKQRVRCNRPLARRRSISHDAPRRGYDAERSGRAAAASGHLQPSAGHCCHTRICWVRALVAQLLPQSQLDCTHAPSQQSNCRAGVLCACLRQRAALTQALLWNP